MVVINLWGAPSSGKSTNSAGLYYLMKMNKFKAELIHEYVKDMIYEEHLSVIKDQNFIFANQNRMLARLEGKVDYVITDSPLPLSCYYAAPEYLKKHPHFIQTVWDTYYSYTNINFLLTQDHDFENYGRIHNESQAKQIQIDLKSILTDNSIVHFETKTKPDLINELFRIVYEIHKEGHITPSAIKGVFEREMLDKKLKQNMMEDNIVLMKL